MQNTVRRARQLQADHGKIVPAGWKLSLFASPKLAWAVVVLILLGGISTLPVFRPDASRKPAVVENNVRVSPEIAEVLTAELEVLAMVNEFLAVGDPSQLDDEALAELLF